jgi:hypothetical protein
MKRIKKEELPIILTDDIITILAEMADETPQSIEWQEIFDVLSPADFRKIMDRKLELQKQKEQALKESMTEEEKLEQESKRAKMIEKLKEDPNTSYGNMGQPDTPEQYKNRYGVWPSGYDEHGNKLNN